MCPDEVQHTHQIDDIDALILYHSLASVSPTELVYTNCRGDKCRRDFSPNSGNWCTACNGTFESAGQVISLFKSDIRFNDIPREAILHIETKETPIDWTNEADLKLASQKVAKDVTRVAEIDERIKSGGLYDRMVATYIQSIKDKRQQDKRHLECSQESLFW